MKRLNSRWTKGLAAFALCLSLSTSALAFPYVVHGGDSLWRIARDCLGSGARWGEIYEANRGEIRNPRLIYAGQILEVPYVAKNAQISFRFASAEEGAALMLGNTAYYDGFSQNDLDFRLGKTGATMAEYQTFAKQQTRSWTDAERTLISSLFSGMEWTLEKNGYTLPPLDEIVFIKTTMQEEAGAGGYTHGTQIYLGSSITEYAATGKNAAYVEYMREILWHELFHCLTRCNPEFRSEMYRIIHFTTQDGDFPLPPSVFAYHISNPDVEHHDSCATFLIDGKAIDCFTDFVTTKHFETEGESFFDSGTTALVPVDGTDIYYTPEQSSNFDEVFGRNTGYVIDPEECMADNFAYALAYGMAGEEGKGYPNPEIIGAILDILRK